MVFNKLKKYLLPVLIVLFLFTPAFAGYNALMYPKFKWFDSSGDPATGWLVYTYETGTTTAKTSYQTPSGTANANPVVLSSLGEADIYLDTSTGNYTIVLKDADDVTSWTLNDVSGSASGSITHSVVATLAVISTGMIGGEERVVASTGNHYTWDLGNTKWRIASGNRYTTAGLPTTTTYTIETGTFVFDTTVNQIKQWNGTAFRPASGNIVRIQVFN